MVRKSKKGIVGKNTVPGAGRNVLGPGLDLITEDLKYARQIREAEERAKREQGLE